MRHLLKTLAAVAVALPLAASADIANSKHDLASGSSATIKSTNQDQTCIFCHTPHHAAEQALLWNRQAANDYTGGFTSGSTTTKGTTLPTTLNSASAACMSCHDGTATLNQLNYAGQVGTPTMAGGVNAVGTAYRISATAATTGSLDGNHPVSVAYPAATDNMYVGVVSTGCTNASGICTTGHLTVQLYGTSAAPIIECGSCHEPHNRYTQSYFLRETSAQSAICKACHIK